MALGGLAERINLTSDATLMTILLPSTQLDEKLVILRHYNQTLYRHQTPFIGYYAEAIYSGHQSANIWASTFQRQSSGNDDNRIPVSSAVSSIALVHVSDNE